MVTYKLDFASEKHPDLVIHLAPGASAARMAKLVCDWFDEPLAKMVNPRDQCVVEITETIRQLVKTGLGIEEAKLSELLKHTASHRLQSQVFAHLEVATWERFWEFEGWKVLAYLGKTLGALYLINKDPEERDELVEEVLKDAIFELVCTKCLVVNVIKHPEKFAWNEGRSQEMPSEGFLLEEYKKLDPSAEQAADLLRDLRYRLTQ